VKKRNAGLAGGGKPGDPNAPADPLGQQPQQQQQQPRKERGQQQPQQQRGPKPEGSPRGPREGGAGGRPERQAGSPGGGGNNRPPGGGGGRDRGPRYGDRREGGGGGRPGGGPRFDGPMLDIDIEKLIADSLYLDNQAHAVVSRLRDMDSGTKSQLRRFYNAVRRACRTPEGERQHAFVMLRARLAYTIARHSLRGLDALEKLLLQVTRKNAAPGYERFRDLFEAIVAYNE